MNWHPKLGPRRDDEEPSAPPWPTHCHMCADPLTGKKLFCSTCGAKVPEPQLPQASTELVPRLCRWDNDGGLGVNRGIQVSRRARCHPCCGATTGLHARCMHLTEQLCWRNTTKQAAGLCSLRLAGRLTVSATATRRAATTAATWTR